MKILLSLLMTTLFLFSSNLSRLYKLYEKQEYDKACNYAHKYYYKKQNRNSENYSTFYALSCLETNNLSRVAIPMASLTKSKDARANASYFATILLQKQLLLQALIDKKPLANLQLPNTNFIISKIFTLFLEKKYLLEDDIYKFTDKNLTYQLYIKKDKRSRQYMIIDIYKDEKFTKRYQYR
ncbi:hypothetical protein MNB_SV-14-1198 [hydrothermal vent metagenome]|uniref:Uncharacterized protein n=1 Tax=hydrothermal vent metagenome TaxID=652676 RepID=A0A1W1CQF5_9ZZZZ